MKKLSQSLGFKKFYFTNKITNLQKLIKKFLTLNGPSFLHIKINKGTLSNLIRPKNFDEIKRNFMK